MPIATALNTNVPPVVEVVLAIGAEVFGTPLIMLTGTDEYKVVVGDRKDHLSCYHVKLTNN